MVKVTVLYGHPEDPAAFEEHYMERHLPLVENIPDLERFEAARVVATPDGGEPPYYRIVELYFESLERMQESLGSEGGEATVEDIPNFATGGATVFISELD